MKKILYIFATAALVLACSKENNQIAPVQNTKGTEVSFSVSVEQTKSTVNASGFAWTETDQVAVYTNNGEKLILTPSEIDGASALFKGTLSEGDAVNQNALVVYPASILSAEDQVTFPSSYDNGKGIEGPALVAKVDGNSLSFKYLTGAINFTVSDVPSVATAIVVNTRSAADDADFVCTGSYTVDFSGETPALTGAASTGSVVTISGLSAGANTVTVPLAQGEQKVYVSVKLDDKTLYSKSVNLTATNAVSRNFYAAMPALTINPLVYIVGDRIGWDANENTLVSTTNFVGTRNDFVVTSKRYFRADVKYGEVTLKYGQATQTSALAGGNFILSEAATYIPYSGVYNIEFNYVTAEFAVTPTSIPAAYMIGVDGNWTFDMSAPMTAIPNTNIVYRKGSSSNGSYKVFERGISDWNEYVYGSAANYYYWTENIRKNTEDGKDCGGGDGVVVFDFGHYKYHGYGLTTEASSVVLRGSFDSWGDGISFSKVDPGSGIWSATFSLDASAEVKFQKNKSDDGWCSNGRNMVDSPYFYDMGNDSNMTLPAGKYTIVFVDQNNSYHLFVND